MFTVSKSKSHRESASFRAGKSVSKKQKSSKDYSASKRLSMHQVLTHPPSSSAQSSPVTLRANSSPTSPNVNSAIVTISVGHEQRLFAAHEDVLCKSPFFAEACRAQFFETAGKRIDLPSEIPEVFSAILEYLYKGDYTPKIQYSKKQGRWYLEDGETAQGNAVAESIIFTRSGAAVLKDTVIYCSADRYALHDLQRLALKKQGLQSGVQCGTILASARFAYAHTPASDSKLRAHYLALIIRSRNTFKRSGTMQMEMEAGGTPLFFDLTMSLALAQCVRSARCLCVGHAAESSTRPYCTRLAPHHDRYTYHSPLFSISPTLPLHPSLFALSSTSLHLDLSNTPSSTPFSSSKPSQILPQSR
ncbi:hypothetical protein MRB53_040296 [Persea americana]|nr:hypothetical protein MRB53_040296 [Persea americana]